MAATRNSRRVAALTALSAALLLGGVAAAQADGPACRHGKGKGMGIGAPGNGKGKGAERGWPHGCRDKDHPDEEQAPDAAPENPGPSVDGSSTDNTETPGTEVNVEVAAEVTLPDAAELAGQTVETVQDAAGLLRPFAETVLGQVHQVVEQTQEAAHESVDLARTDVAGIVGLLQESRTEAAGLPAPSLEAGVIVAGTDVAGALTVNGPTLSGVTTLADHLAGGAFGLTGGTATGLRGIVAGFVLPF